jgi:hypothetical protein
MPRRTGKGIRWKPCGARLRGERAGRTCQQPGMANGRCRMHGGLTPKGVEHGAFRHGRHTTAIPDRMQKRYEQGLHDPDLLVLRDEIRLVDARISDLLARVDSGESGATWIDLQQSVDAFMQTQGREDEPGKQEARQHLAHIIALVRRGHSDSAAWAEVMALTERRRKLVESERKRMVQMAQMISLSEFMTLIRLVQETVARNIQDRGAIERIYRDLERLLDSGSERSDPTPRDAITVPGIEPADEAV